MYLFFLLDIRKNMIEYVLYSLNINGRFNLNDLNPSVK